MLSSRLTKLWRWWDGRQQGSIGDRLWGGVNAAIDLLYPLQCTYCGRELEATARQFALCPACRGRFSGPREACGRCASPLPRYWGEHDCCPHCSQRRYYFERAEALGDYRDEFQQAVLSMKCLRHEPLTRAMGKLLARHVADRFANWGVELIVPVPMHYWRKLRRGTHTAHVLGQQVAQSLQRPLLDRTLVCRRKSLKQGTLAPSERFRNMRGAFAIATGYDINEKRVLLVDDIMTTGATASEAARILRRAGAAAVAVAVVARGTGRH